MQQPKLLFIHGGMTFKTKDDYIHFLKTRAIDLEKKERWNKGYLSKQLGNVFQIIQPRMPLQDNAQYEEWKIYFERFIDLLGTKFLLIGESLGGIFLAKYLSENRLPTKALGVYLVGAPFDDSLPGEDLAGGFELGKNLSLITENTHFLHFFFSKDDEIVPLAHAEKFKQALENKAQFHIVSNMQGHFFVSEFPQIIEKIKRDVEEHL